MKKQIINPLVGFGQRSIGRYANRIGSNKFARASGPKDKRGGYLLLESGDKILLEDNSGALILE